jgi:copper chaperone CopZ
MSENRVKFSSIVESQLPGFVRENFPLIGEFLSQYYRSLEDKSLPVDILNNIDKYIKLDNITNLIDNTTLTQDIDFSDNLINVESTYGFPDSYGLIQINSEIISYKSKTETSFVDCFRGFSGISTYNNFANQDSLVFLSTSSENHESGSIVDNLNIKFLKLFLKKIKTQFSPGFENFELNERLNDNIFIKQSKDFYTSKGTERSFEILFKALYDDLNVSVIRPSDKLFIPSNNDWRVNLELVVEPHRGDPLKLINRTVIQSESGSGDLENLVAYGTVNDVQEFKVDDKLFYKLKIDYGKDNDLNLKGSVFGDFYIHPFTKTTSPISIGATHIDVDSTIGFPDSGQLILEFDNLDLDTEEFIIIEYRSKTLTQFLDVDAITRSFPKNYTVRFFDYIFAEDDEEDILLFVNGVLSELETPFKLNGLESNDLALIKTLGVEYADDRAISWLFNIPTTNEVDGFDDNGNLRYEIFTKDNFLTNPGDFVDLEFLVLNPNGIRERVKKEFQVERGSIPKQSFKIINNYPILEVYTVTKNLTKVKGTIYNANVQSTYVDYDNNVYVSSYSSPNYFNEDLETKINEVYVSGSFNSNTVFTSESNHNFIDGESVVFVSLSEDNDINILNIPYFVKVLTQNSFSLSASLVNLYNNIFVSFTGIILSGKFIKRNYFSSNLKEKVIKPQPIIRKIGFPIEESFPQPILPEEKIGILSNGVEIVTYKSSDFVYYGGLEKINVLSSGFNYDLINPPSILISDSVGFGASAYCSSMEGELSKIEVLDGGFDYLDVPTITVTGGNSQGSKCIAELVGIDYIVYFDSDRNVKLIDNTIIFDAPHKFRDSESIVYRDGGLSVGGLLSGTIYYVSVIDSKTVKLYSTVQNSQLKVNEIQLISHGEGIHSLSSTSPKSKINSIKILETNKFYSKKRIVKPENVNTLRNVIYFKDHNYLNGEKVVYDFVGESISGLSTSETYYVSVIDSDNFKLALKNTDKELFEGKEDYFLETEQFIEFSTKGSGVHIFNYPKITLSIIGRVGVSTLSGEDYNAKLVPIITGSINEVSLENSGVGYGSSEIINLNRKPSLNISKGIGAQATPLISKISDFQFGLGSSGRIVDVVMNSFGTGYSYGSFDLKIITKTGIGAVLTPVIDESNGSIKNILVISGGYGYSEEDRIEIVNRSQGAILDPIIKSWNINEVQRKILQNEIFSDDGYYTNSIINETEIQYTHIYPPRKLRSLVYSTKIEEGISRYKTDLQNDFTIPFHSPILGWAYDGNPIYGPYAYSTPSGGRVRQMVSGYKVSTTISKERPPVSKYPLGFFTDDYYYDGTGDLDEYNGRFCITPEYPNGTYAYFSSLSLNRVIGGVLDGNKFPNFPYFIGPEFKNKKDKFNYSPLSNQVNLDITQTDWRRNVLPYNLNEEFSGYDYLFDPNSKIPQYSRVESTSLSLPKSISVINPGSNYRVGDQIVFEDDKFERFNLINDGQFTSSQIKAKVSTVTGKEISSLIVTKDVITNIEIENTSIIPDGFIAIASTPHNLKTTDIISISGISTIAKKSIESVQVIETIQNELTLISPVGPSSVTGIITYFNISSNNYPDILFRENDIYKINNEKIKILNIDKPNFRIKVLREYDNTVGLSHSIYTKLFEDSRKFKITLKSFDFENSFKSDREFYFNPKESLSIGVSSDVGVGSTVIIVNPGFGSTQRFILNGLVYINNHKFNTNDKVVYDSNEGDSLSISINEIGENLNNIEPLYAIKFDKDYIGLSTVRVGLNTLQQYVGIETTYFPIYFTGIGTGDNHSFKTDYTNKFLVDILKKKITVNTEENHGLLINDFVDINSVPNLETRYNIIYNDTNRRLITNRVGFSSENVSIEENSIFIENHKLINGQKVIHISDDPSDGLENNQIYFIVKITDNKIALTTSYFNSTFVYGEFDKVVNINSQSTGELYQINPTLNSPKNNKVVFDLSHPSLSYVRGSEVFPAFDFELFTDPNYRNEFISTKNSSEFQIKKIGSIGVSTDARCEIIFDENENFPNSLYYRLIPVKNSNLPRSKSEYFIDSDYVRDPNKLVFSSSYYGGSFVVSGISSNSFSYFNYSENEYDYEPSQYLKKDGNFYYFTSSNNTTGGISDIQLTQIGENRYENLPKVSNILTNTGSGALLECKSDDMGVPSVIKISNIGFSYSSDYTLRPTAKFPYIITLDLRYTLDQIKVTGLGTNYTIFPDLIIKDSETNEIIREVILDYDSETNIISILQNTFSLTNSKPIIIPINNTNGFSIKNIEYSLPTKTVTVTFKTSFSSLNDFPFIVGDKFLIENTTTTVKGSLGKEFNSSDYNYEFFEVLSIDPNIGGSNASITYSVSKFVQENETLGVYDSIISSGLIIPEKYFPTFDVLLKEVSFIDGESIKFFEDNTNEPIGRIERWFPERRTIKLLSEKYFNIGDIIEGLTSNSISTIKEIQENTAVYQISASSIVEEGWKSDYGLLNDDLQKIHDSDYYQYFSYSIKTKVPFEIWDDAVSSLNHTPGFRKFGDLSVESLSKEDIGISTIQNLGGISVINDIFEVNRVLMIDNISGEFNSDPRATPFSIVDSFRLDEIRSRKFILFVRDKRFIDERQIYLVSLLHDGTFGYINQYGRIESDMILGSFEFTVFDVEGRLLFYPINSAVNNYDISFLSYDMIDGFIGIGSTSFGNIVDIQTEQEFVVSGNSTTISRNTFRL